MPSTRTVAIALGVTTGVFFLLAIFMLVRKKHVYVSFIPGLGESRDRLAARTRLDDGGGGGYSGRRIKGKEKKKKKKKKGEGEGRVEVPFGLKLEVYRGEGGVEDGSGNGNGSGDGSGAAVDVKRNDEGKGEDGANDGWK
ncbi:hypothetical protein BST61_g11350 [Cercospora zeina]